MAEIQDHMSCPECPDCETNVLVAGTNLSGFDYQCFGCGNHFNA